jgi:hypothetical protein
MRSCASRGARLPDAGFDEPFAKRLERNRHAVQVSELLARERRTEVQVALAHELNDVRLVGVRHRAIASLAAARRRQSRSSTGFVSVSQSLHLSNREPERFSRLALRGAPVRHSLNPMKSIEFLGTH